MTGGESASEGATDPFCRSSRKVVSSSLMIRKSGMSASGSNLFFKGCKEWYLHEQVDV